MSSSSSLGALNSEAQIWPILTDAEIHRARAYRRVRYGELGEILYRPGDVGASCFILLSATVRIVQPGSDGERLITNHCPRTFTGEAGMIAGQRTLVLARVVQSGELLELLPEDVRTLVRWLNKQTGQLSSAPARHVFIMTGASPNTNWLRGRLVLDEKGFIVTGPDLQQTVESGTTPSWSLSRLPQIFESSLPGVFAVGDVRAGSVKRLAAAVGEGSTAVSLVHRALAEF